MYSIRKKLVSSISMVLLLLLVVMFVVLDITIDDWAEKQFDHTLMEKANALTTLVKEYDDHVAFDFSDEFMPQYSSERQDEFFQLWRNQQSIEKSPSLQAFTGMDLYRTTLPLGSHIFIDQTLPNGLDGRILLVHFLPQIHSELGDVSDQQAMYLSLGAPLTELEHFLLLVDFLLLLTLAVTILFTRYLVARIIKQGLAPLIEFNDQIKRLDITQEKALVAPPETAVIEIEPIRKELNKFIAENKQLIENEKRLTSDITHEIKTPITEIISLSEMSIKYPNEPRINNTYKQDVLNSANRLKDIVQKLALLHRSTQHAMVFTVQPHFLSDNIHQVLGSLAFKYPQKIEHCEVDNIDPLEQVNIDQFCFTTVLTNLLDNALFYGKQGLDVNINISRSSDKMVKIEVINHVAHPLNATQLANMFEPFYQVDQSRTDASHHGLGLAIVKKLSDLADYHIAVDYRDQQIAFTFQVASA